MAFYKVDNKGSVLAWTSLRAGSEPVSDLAGVLAKLYPDRDRIRLRLLTSGTGIDSEKIDFGGDATLIWDRTLDEAWKRGLIEILVDVVANDYKESAEVLSAAKDDYLAARGRRPSIRAGSDGMGTEATLKLVFWDANEKQWVDIDDPAVLPVRQGHEFRINVLLNRPAFVYVIWIDGQGNVTPLYPWNLESDFPDWKPLEPEKATAELTLPAGGDGKVLAIEGPGGVETLVLLVRDQPLSAQEHERFRGWLPTTFPAVSTLSLTDRPRWMTFYRRKEQAGGGDRTGILADRGVGQPQVPSDPLCQLDALLRDRLGPRFLFLKAVSFMNHGRRAGGP